MKRIWLLVLWLAWLTPISCAMAEEPWEPFVSGNYEYRLLADGTAEITGYTGTQTELLLPSELDGHAVTAIADWAFHDDKLTSLYMPDSVTNVGRGVMDSVSGRIRLSGGLRYDFTAREARRLVYIFPDAITDERMQIFLAQLSAREQRTIKDSYMQLGVDPATGKSYYRKSQDIAALQETYPALAEGKVIWVLRKPKEDMSAATAQKTENAFANAGYTAADMESDYVATHGQTMPALPWYRQELTLPYSLASYYEWTVCKGCEVANVSGGLELAWFVENGAIPVDPRCGDFIYALREDGTARLIAYTGQNSTVIVPETLDGYTVAAIGGEAFIFGENVTTVSLPDTVTELSPTAFLCCETLMDIRVTPDHPTLAVIDGVLFEKTTRTLLCYPEGRTEETYQIPRGIRCIAPYAFSGRGRLNTLSLYATVGSHYTNEDGLRQLMIPDSVTEIASYAFYGNSSLTGVHIETGVTSIGDMAFYNCDALETVHIPGNVLSIGVQAFYDCNALRNVTLDEGVATIGNFAFVYCTALRELTLPDSVAELGTGVFSGTALTRVCIGAGVTELPQRAFYGCGELTDVELPVGLTVIGEEAFVYCTALTAVTIPDSVTVLGKSLFSDCAALTEIHIGAGVTAIPEKAFYGCKALTTMSLPACVTTIGDEAFSGCCGLTELTLQQGLTSIGFQAFMHCCSLTDVTLPEGLVTIGGEAFAGCWKLESITIPASVTEIVSYPFSACDALSVINVQRDSYAVGFCRAYDLPYAYPDALDWLLD